MKSVFASIPSSFTARCYLALMQVPKGKITTYQDLAAAAGSPGAARAAGMAMRKNPFPNEVPCYKVIKSNGEIGGYGGTASNRNRNRKCQFLEADGITVNSKGFVENLDSCRYDWR